MSELRYSEEVIFREFGGFDESPKIEKKEPVSDEFYNSLLDKINSAAKKNQDAHKEDDPLSKDNEVSDLLKATARDIFDGTHGVNFKDSYAILDDEDKAEFESIILDIMGAIEEEMASEDKAGLVQGLFDRLFPENAKFVDPYDAVRATLLKLQQDGDVTPEELMNRIIPMILEAATKTGNEATYEYGVVKLDDEEMSLEDMYSAMQEIAAMMAEVDAGVNPEVPTENPDDVPEVPEIPENPEDVPEVPENPEDVPEVPENPEDVPDVPTENPDDVPEVPETPTDNTEVPEVPTDNTDVPEVPTDSTETTDVPEIPTESVEGSTEPIETPEEMAELLSSGQIRRASQNIVRNSTELEEIAVSTATPNVDGFAEVTMNAQTAQSIQSQVLSAVESRLANIGVNANDEVNIILNPENLGRISVRISNGGGDTLIRIAAENEETRAVLLERLPSLMESLSQINNSVREITVEEVWQSAEMQTNLFGGQNGTFAGNRNGQGNYNGSSAESQTTEAVDSTENIMKGANRLWQKA